MRRTTSIRHAEKRGKEEGELANLDADGVYAWEELAKRTITQRNIQGVRARQAFVKAYVETASSLFPNYKLLPRRR